MKSEDYLLLSITFAVASVVWVIFNYELLFGDPGLIRSTARLICGVFIVLFVAFLFILPVKYVLEKAREKGDS